MRIGLVTGEYPPLQGGVSSHVAVLARYLMQHGHEPFILSNESARQQHAHIPVDHHIRKWNIGALSHLRGWIASHQLEVVNMHFQTAAYDMSPWVHVMPHVADVPFVTTFHDLRFPYLFPKAGKLRDWIVMHLARASDGIIVTNHEDLQRVQHLNASMIPIGSSIERTPPPDKAAIRQQLSIPPDAFLIAHFGFINHSKGVDTLLRALAQLDDPQIRLLMIGDRTGTADPTNAAYAASIDALIAELNIAEQIIWTGYVTMEEVGTYLQGADVVALPFRDGASFRRSSLMAAIEHACAIITTQPTVSVPEFSEERLILVERDHVTQLADALHHLQGHPSHRKQLRQNVRDLRRVFDWDRITQAHLDFFADLVESTS